jgi:hypothetical protein
MGKAFQEALADVDDTAACFEYYAGQAEELDKRQWQKIVVPNQQFVSRVRYEPVGVCGAVIPFVREIWRAILHLSSYFFQMHFSHLHYDQMFCRIIRCSWRPGRLHLALLRAAPWWLSRLNTRH